MHIRACLVCKLQGIPSPKSSKVRKFYILFAKFFWHFSLPKFLIMRIFGSGCSHWILKSSHKDLCTVTELDTDTHQHILKWPKSPPIDSSHGVNPLSKVLPLGNRKTMVHVIQINQGRKIEHKTLQSKFKSCATIYFAPSWVNSFFIFYF